MTGRLIYLMEPFGLGKNSLLQAVREPLALHDCRIARRVITCSVEAVGEGAQAMTPTQSDTLERTSVFIMNWRVNDPCYGVPVQTDKWLAQGYDALVNGSCGCPTQARWRYPDLLTVLLGVRPEVLRQRLPARGRESPGEIEIRLACNTEFAADLKGPLFQLDNSDDLDDTPCSLLVRLGGDRACA